MDDDESEAIGQNLALRNRKRFIGLLISQIVEISLKDFVVDGHIGDVLVEYDEGGLEDEVLLGDLDVLADFEHFQDEIKSVSVFEN